VTIGRAPANDQRATDLLIGAAVDTLDARPIWVLCRDTLSQYDFVIGTFRHASSGRRPQDCRTGAALR
jgi:hypothetical protein